MPSIPAVQIEKTRLGWLAQTLTGLDDVPTPPESATIEKRARASNELGRRPLWSGYRSVADYPTATTGTRTANEVRSDAAMGCLFAWLVTQRRPEVIVEFGTAFGVSGMYWLAGIEATGIGTLFTFEPNANWAAIADRNLAGISSHYRLTVGTFEDNVGLVLGDSRIDIAFVDAIHTGAFVREQYAILRRHLRPGALVLFDDIGFSRDMRDCWTAIAAGPEVISSARLGDRLGIVEVSGS